MCKINLASENNIRPAEMKANVEAIIQSFLREVARLLPVLHFSSAFYLISFENPTTTFGLNILITCGNMGGEIIVFLWGERS